MPILHSKYQGPPFFYFNGHFETIIPSIRRKIVGVSYERERIETPDDDFLDIDWVRRGNNRLLVVSHGLEGDSGRHYVTGLAKLFGQNGWDILAWNNRTCSGEMNRQKILYHHAASYDLRSVIEHANNKYDYDQIGLVGISMGGGQTLRYLGESDFPLPKNVKGAVAISAPCSLIESAATLNLRVNKVYEQKFLVKLREKIKKKAIQFPEIDVSRMDTVKTLKEFDNLYSGPIHGFKDAKEFYEFCDPYPFIKNIEVPILLINALNDPLLEGNCYPYQLAEEMPNLYLETPKRGGHVGFILAKSEFTYSELRALEFLNEEKD
ncbi:YheT family hydrolase [Roseivirga seohaensis]|uniref:YheT family hydrolase n=1 Tax=Roseivirga seohaensis TaxID=1914963 RepID=UPI003BACA171